MQRGRPQVTLHTSTFDRPACSQPTNVTNERASKRRSAPLRNRSLLNEHYFNCAVRRRRIWRQPAVFRGDLGARNWSRSDVSGALPRAVRQPARLAPRGPPQRPVTSEWRTPQLAAPHCSPCRARMSIMTAHARFCLAGNFQAFRTPRERIALTQYAVRPRPAPLLSSARLASHSGRESPDCMAPQCTAHRDPWNAQCRGLIAVL